MNDLLFYINCVCLLVYVGDFIHNALTSNIYKKDTVFLCVIATILRDMIRGMLWLMTKTS